MAKTTDDVYSECLQRAGGQEVVGSSIDFKEIMERVAGLACVADFKALESEQEAFSHSAQLCMFVADAVHAKADFACLADVPTEVPAQVYSPSLH